MEVLRFETLGTRIRVQKWQSKQGGDPVLLASCDIRADKTKQTDREFRIGAESLNIPKTELMCYASAYAASGTSLFPLGAPTEKPYRVRLRTQSETLRFDTFEQALASATHPDSVIEWESKEMCCAVDLDFHASPPPSLINSAMALRPAPWRWWITKGGGLRCVYLATDNQTANALAGLAALELLASYPTAGLELLSRTRTMPQGTQHGGSYITGVIDDTSDGARKLQGKYTVEDAEYAGWLEARNFEVGQRYPHDLCPANPHVRAHANTAPVVVHDDHVFCFVCSADGVCHGSYTPGYFPAARLCGSYARSLFALCVENFTHWNHAKHIVSTLPGLFGREELARCIYHAALARTHGTDPRVPLVFSQGENLIRYEAHWGDDQGKPVVFQEQRPQRLYSLPAALNVEDGKLKPSMVRGEWLQHHGDISRYGYPAIIPIWGFHTTFKLEPVGWKVHKVLDTQSLRSEAMRERRPRYLVPSARVASPYAALQSLFPGLNVPFVKLLVVAKGCAELNAGLPPMIFASGPTGSGKSASIQIAASILGDHVGEVPYTANIERLRAGLMSAKKAGTFACFDEFLKGAAAQRKTPEQGMEVLLNFTPDSESHIIYVGPVPLGSLPVCVWCDTALPVEIIQHAQLARRLCWVRLPSRMTWEASLKAADIPGPGALRTHGDKTLIHALDSVLSEIIDEYLSATPVFSTIVRALGFRMLEDIDVAREKEKVIVAFFDELALAAEVCPPLQVGGSGWRRIDRTQESVRLSQLWAALADASGTASRALEETDLAQVLKQASVTRFECRTQGHFIYARFIHEGVELQTNGSSVHGPGDAECSQPQDVWVFDLPVGCNDATPLGGIPPWEGSSGMGTNGTGTDGP